jgi:hypothetical protein
LPCSQPPSAPRAGTPGSTPTSGTCKPVVKSVNIRICGFVPVPLTYGSGSGSCFFRQWLTRCQQKNNFLSKCFCFLLSEVTFTSVFKDKSQKVKRSKKLEGFSICSLLLDGRTGSGFGSTTMLETNIKNSKNTKNKELEKERRVNKNDGLLSGLVEQLVAQLSSVVR